MEVLAYTPVELNYFETLAIYFIIPARKNQFLQETIFINTPVLLIAIAINSNSFHWFVHGKSSLVSTVWA